MLTLFSCPKPFRGHIDIIQRNSIHSWILLQPRPEIILMGDEEGMVEIAKEFNIRHIPEVERNDFGTPLVNSIFYTAEKATSNHLMCYINADILLFNDFMEAIQSVLQFKTKCLMIGQRWNLDIDEPIDFSSSWETKIKNNLRKRGKLEIPNGIDYYVFHKGIFGNIKPFALGRTMWDNWLVSKVRLQKIPVINLMERVTAIHQNHDYSHHKNGIVGVSRGEEAKRNIELANGYLFSFTTWDADYKLTKEKVIRRSIFYRFYGELVYLSQKHSFLKPIVRILRLGREGFRFFWYIFKNGLILT